MKKSQLQSVYCNDLPAVPCISEMCKKYPELLDSSPLSPEFLASSSQKQPPADIDNLDSDSRSSATNTVSFCSNFSRVAVDRVLYKEILLKRKDHPIFLELENEEIQDDSRWHYIDDRDGKFLGPLTPVEMNQRFILEVFQENTKMKKKYEEEYYPLSVLIKRYLKNVLAERLEIKKAQAPLSNKVNKFRKGLTLNTLNRQEEKFEQKTREERFFSQATRPNLIDLKRLLPNDIIEENEHSRLRANTHSQRMRLL